MVAQPGEIFAQRRRLWGRPELGRPRTIEVRTDRSRGGRQARVIDVVMDDQGPHPRDKDPDAPVGEQLSEPVPHEEDIEACLPYATSVAPPGHVAGDEQEVAPSTRGEHGVIPEVAQPGRRRPPSAMEGGVPWAWK